MFAEGARSPGDPSLLVKNGDTLTALLEANNDWTNGNFGQLATTPGRLNDGRGLSGTGMVQTNDFGLIWLKDQSHTAPSSTWPKKWALLEVGFRAARPKQTHPVVASKSRSQVSYIDWHPAQRPCISVDVAVVVLQLAMKGFTTWMPFSLPGTQWFRQDRKVRS